MTALHDDQLESASDDVLHARATSDEASAQVSKQPACSVWEFTDDYRSFMSVNAHCLSQRRREGDHRLYFFSFWMVGFR
jgi:hypothetical protein